MYKLLLYSVFIPLAFIIFSWKLYVRITGFDQLSYDWDNITEVTSFKVDSHFVFTSNRLIMFVEKANKFEELAFPVDSLTGIKDSQVFLKLIGEREYVVGAGGGVVNKSRIGLSQLNWVNGVPKIGEKIKKFEIIKVDRKQKNGGFEICMVGDNYLFFEEGQEFRLKWSLKNPDLRFVGTKKDIYGFYHEGQSRNTSELVLKRLSNIPPAQLYFVLLGREETWRPNSEVIKNLREIIQGFKTKNNSCRVILSTVVPDNVSANQKYFDLSNDIRTEDWGKGVYVYDLENVIYKTPNYKIRCFREDRFSFSEEFYNKIVFDLDSLIVSENVF